MKRGLKGKKWPVIIAIVLVYALLSASLQLFPYRQVASVKRWLSRNMNMTTSNTRTEAYQDRVYAFKHAVSGTFDVVFIGDSLTEGGLWSEYFEGVRVANRGIYGDTTAGVLGRMESILSTGAQQAFILIGVNDIFKGAELEEIEARYQDIIDRLIEEDFEVYIQSTLSVFRRDATTEKVNELNKQLAALATSHEQVYYIDVISSLTEDDYKNDGIHLSGSGYVKWKQAVEGYVK